MEPGLSVAEEEAEEEEEEEPGSDSPGSSPLRRSVRWPSHEEPGCTGSSSGPASLGLGATSDGSPGLEYDLWEGQFQFLGAAAAEPATRLRGQLPARNAAEQPLRPFPVHQQVQMIQEQMHALVDTQSAGEERYARVKQENATLQARILMLEESARDAEARAEEKFDAEQRRHREWASRLEREKELQLENLAIKLQAAEQESTRAKDESTRLREQLDKLKNEKARLESSLDEAHQDVERAKEAERRAGLTLADATRQLKRVEEELAQKLEVERRMEELAEEMKSLRIHNKKLEESRDELQAAAAALQAGRELLLTGGQDPNDNTISRKNSPSLATELLLTGSAHDQADGIDTGKSATATDICDNISTLAEAKKALREQREVNAALRAYIDNILLNIVENYPQLLEVKQPH